MLVWVRSIHLSAGRGRRVMYACAAIWWLKGAWLSCLTVLCLRARVGQGCHDTLELDGRIIYIAFLFMVFSFDRNRHFTVRIRRVAPGTTGSQCGVTGAHVGEPCGSCSGGRCSGAAWHYPP